MARKKKKKKKKKIRRAYLDGLEVRLDRLEIALDVVDLGEKCLHKGGGRLELPRLAFQIFQTVRRHDLEKFGSTAWKKQKKNII
jgi:hypothetical protein